MKFKIQVEVAKDGIHNRYYPMIKTHWWMPWQYLRPPKHIGKISAVFSKKYCDLVSMHLAELRIEDYYQQYLSETDHVYDVKYKPKCF